MSVTAVVFDFGNVLGFFSHRQAAAQLAAYSPSATADDVLALLFNGRLEEDYDSGRISSAQLLAILRDRFALSGSDEQLGRALADMFTPNAEVCALVPLLRPRYRLLLLSNTNDLHYRRFKAQLIPPEIVAQLCFPHLRLPPTAMYAAPLRGRSTEQRC